MIGVLRTAAQVDAPLPLWDKTVDIRVGSGYKDNVLLGNISPRASAFVSSGVDLMIMRLPTSGTDFLFFLSGEDRRYLQSVGTDKEDTLISHAQIKHAMGQQWEAGLRLQQLYQNVMYDASTTESDLTTVKLQGHGLSGTPSLRTQLSELNYLAGEFTVTREWLAAPLADYWELGPKMILGREYGHRSEWSVSYAIAQRSYANRFQTSIEGASIPNTSLTFGLQTVEFSLQHNWDEKRRWRTATKLQFERNDDNGTGFYDYNKYQLSQQLRYRVPAWEISGQVKYSHYDFPNRFINFDQRTKRYIDGIFFNLRGEKRLTHSLRLFAEYEYEHSLSNQTTVEYAVNTISSGLNWEF